MKCSRCGNLVDLNNNICSNCGNDLINNNPKKDDNRIKKTILITLLIITFLLIIISIVIGIRGKNIDSRTVMIYMSGSNLESDAGIATADLESIIPSEVDLTNTNVLVYTGGTKLWHNDYVDSDKNNILKLTNNGFEKIESYNKKNLGNAETFESFLDYAYENYNADRYDLLIYNHGLGALGSISDDYANDFLTIFEMDEALEKSYFNNKNKIETVIFRTCLNGTAEVASVFKDYANYMVASEEVTLGNRNSDVLKFINDLSLQDDGYQTGVKFITGYQEFIDSINDYGDIDSTYSIINLNYMDELEKDLDEFFKDIDVSKNYREISKLRDNLHQYAVETANSYDYDTIDLYGLISELKILSPKKGESVLKDLEKLINYNWSSNEFSHGLSIYFPYNGSSGAVNMHFEVYDEIDFSKNYYSFIKSFRNVFANNSNTSKFNITMDYSKENEQMKNGEFSMKLTDEQVKNFSSARYIVFEKHENGTYGPVIRSKATLTKDGILKANVKDNIIKVIDKRDNSEDYVYADNISSDGDYDEYILTAMLDKVSPDGFHDDDIISAAMHLKVKDGKVNIGELIKKEEGRESGTLVNDKDYLDIKFMHHYWDILDDDGAYRGNIKTTGGVGILSLSPKEGYEFKLSSLDDGNYYAVFQIKDVLNNNYYSKFVKIN